MTRAVAINVAANTNLPGFRGPIYPDGRFEYIPIPEREPVDDGIPTYADLDLETPIPEDVRETPVHLDPAFAEYPCCDRYTYGDEHGVKARPLTELSAGEYVLFYATLSTTDAPNAEPWIAPEWGAYVIGQFRLARDPLTGDGYRALPTSDQEWFASNAHVRRERFDAEVLLAGDPDGSKLYDRALPLSAADSGADANRLVTDLSSDSGKGPWWRRPLRFDDAGVAELLEIKREGAPERAVRREL